LADRKLDARPGAAKVPPKSAFTAVFHQPNSVETPSSEQRRWFTDEVHPHDAALRSYVRRAFPAVRDVDDVVQESYLRIWRSRAAEPIRCARAFLFTIARNVALKRVGRQRSSPEIIVGDLSALGIVAEGQDAAEIAARNETFRLLITALATLPPRCREITVLRKLKGVPQKEVAARLGIAEKTVEEQVARGVKRCEDYLRRCGVTHFLPR
jgi:RNA polymerase sigma-70 factor (ECF subfamily)